MRHHVIGRCPVSLNVRTIYVLQTIFIQKVDKMPEVLCMQPDICIHIHLFNHFFQTAVRVKQVRRHLGKTMIFHQLPHP